MKIRVGHLYPEYLNIYADRGNIAVLAVRARARGHELDVTAIVIGSRGVRGLREFASGSVSHDVATHTRRPVLIVPPVTT